MRNGSSLGSLRVLRTLQDTLETSGSTPAICYQFIMHISLWSLQRAHPLAVRRLAHYVGLVTLGRTTEDIIEELHLTLIFQQIGK